MINPYPPHSAFNISDTSPLHLHVQLRQQPSSPTSLSETEPENSKQRPSLTVPDFLRTSTTEVPTTTPQAPSTPNPPASLLTASAPASATSTLSPPGLVALISSTFSTSLGSLQSPSSDPASGSNPSNGGGDGSGRGDAAVQFTPSIALIIIVSTLGSIFLVAGAILVRHYCCQARGRVGKGERGLRRRRGQGKGDDHFRRGRGVGLGLGVGMGRDLSVIEEEGSIRSGTDMDTKQGKRRNTEQRGRRLYSTVAPTVYYPNTSGSGNPYAPDADLEAGYYKTLGMLYPAGGPSYQDQNQNQNHHPSNGPNQLYDHANDQSYSIGGGNEYVEGDGGAGSEGGGRMRMKSLQVGHHVRVHMQQMQDQGQGMRVEVEGDEGEGEGLAAGSGAAEKKEMRSHASIGIGMGFMQQLPTSQQEPFPPHLQNQSQNQNQNHPSLSRSGTTKSKKDKEQPSGVRFSKTIQAIEPDGGVECYKFRSMSSVPSSGSGSGEGTGRSLPSSGSGSTVTSTTSVGTGIPNSVGSVGSMGSMGSVGSVNSVGSGINSGKGDGADGAAPPVHDRVSGGPFDLDQSASHSSLAELARESQVDISLQAKTKIEGRVREEGEEFSVLAYMEGMTLGEDIERAMRGGELHERDSGEEERLAPDVGTNRYSEGSVYSNVTSRGSLIPAPDMVNSETVGYGNQAGVLGQHANTDDFHPSTGSKDDAGKPTPAGASVPQRQRSLTARSSRRMSIFVSEDESPSSVNAGIKAPLPTLQTNRVSSRRQSIFMGQVEENSFAGILRHLPQAQTPRVLQDSALQYSQYGRMSPSRSLPSVDHTKKNTAVGAATAAAATANKHKSMLSPVSPDIASRFDQAHPPASSTLASKLSLRKTLPKQVRLNSKGQPIKSILKERSKYESKSYGLADPQIAGMIGQANELDHTSYTAQSQIKQEQSGRTLELEYAQHPQQPPTGKRLSSFANNDVPVQITQLQPVQPLRLPRKQGIESQIGPHLRINGPAYLQPVNAAPIRLSQAEFLPLSQMNHLKKEPDYRSTTMSVYGWYAT